RASPRCAEGVRLINLRRIRTQNADAMMRWLPQYFRPTESRGLAFTTQWELEGPGGGEWVMRIGDERCDVRPGRTASPDLTIRAPATYFLAVHRGEASAVLGLRLGRIRLPGPRRRHLPCPALPGVQ